MIIKACSDKNPRPIHILEVWDPMGEFRTFECPRGRYDSHWSDERGCEVTVAGRRGERTRVRSRIACVRVSVKAKNKGDSNLDDGLVTNLTSVRGKAKRLLVPLFHCNSYAYHEGNFWCLYQPKPGQEITVGVKVSPPHPYAMQLQVQARSAVANCLFPAARSEKAKR